MIIRLVKVIIVVLMELDRASASRNRKSGRIFAGSCLVDYFGHVCRMETFLDGPVSPTHSIVSRSQSALPSVLSPEEKYIVTPPQHIPPPLTPKPPLEIPAESNPSPRIPETNIELFNNNIPKNCTIVQAGHCKPYHEETKPFEMSDFYKYSTKFKKSPVKQQQDDSARKSLPPNSPFQKNLNETFDKASVPQTVKNHNFSPSS